MASTYSGNQVQGEAIVHMGHVINKHYHMSGESVSEEDRRSISQARRKIEILKTLHTSPYRDRKDRNPKRVPRTCEWFVTHELFQKWRESKSSCMLWVSADPGCGKSVLAKYLADEVLQTTGSRTTCYFFFKDDFEDQRSANSALCCILHQLFDQRKDLLSNKIVERFEAYGERLTGSIAELWDLLVMVSQDMNLGEIVCILDAFDECDEQGRLELTRVLCKFYDLPVIRLSGESEAEVSKIAKEIDIFIKARVRSIQAILKLKPEEELLLESELLRIPHRTYLWAHLTLDLVQTDTNIDKIGIQKVTSHLPQTVDEAYERILAKSCNFEEAKKLLHIVVAAVRPLTLSEMDLALALRESHRSYKDLDFKSEERFREYVRDLCGLFVTVIGSKIYLLHQTAKEFLVQDDSRSSRNNQLRWKSSLQSRESHRILSQICVWHLFFTEFETRPLEETEKLSQYLQDHIFLDYSAKNWAAHFRMSQIHDDAVIASLLEICDANSGRCLTWFRIYWESTHEDFPQHFTTLMIASYFGLGQVVKLLLKTDGVELNCSDGVYERSALSWASENGFDDVVKLLTKRNRFKHITKLKFIPDGVEIEAQDKYGRTPLSCAARKGHVAVAKRLVEAGASVDSRDDIGGTPLSYAICNGQKTLISLLLKKGRQLDSVHDMIQPLLISATEKGDETTVKLLLESGKVDADAKDNYGDTPLWLATKVGHEAMVKVLLESGKVEADAKDDCGRTPLSWAVKYGQEAIVKLLLESGKVDAKSKDEYGHTPLLWAVKYGQETIVKLLLESDNVDANSKDTYGRTPLLWAVKYGHEAIVELLLVSGKVDADLEDNNGETPLFWATRNGHEAILGLLRSHGARIRRGLPARSSLVSSTQNDTRRLRQNDTRRLSF